jgi:prepilin-type processing-associated H-X9-DG protein/prepilin-type N-terminal cleavage/methylation domain-containing protein
MRPGRLARRAFTLTEVVIVVGLLALMASLLLPVIAKMRAAANSTVCAANLRSMGNAWSAYMVENQGEFIPYVWQTPPTPLVAWNAYWPGTLDKAGVRGSSLLCPVASDPVSVTSMNRGYGNAANAWSGRGSANGTCIRIDANRFRDSSFGFNRYLTQGGGFGGNRMSAMRDPSDVPVFFDAAYADVRPINGSEATPPQPPPNLKGTSITPGSPDHWLFLLARHGRGINVYMADGSVRWVAAEETYMLTWKADWTKLHLVLPNS